MSTTFRTTLTLGIFDGRDHDMSLAIEYTGVPAKRACWDEPGHDDYIDVEGIEVNIGKEYYRADPWLDALIRNDDALMASIMEEWQSQRASDAEYRAELRREDRRAA